MKLPNSCYSHDRLSERFLLIFLPDTVQNQNVSIYIPSPPETNGNPWMGRGVKKTNGYSRVEKMLSEMIAEMNSCQRDCRFNGSYITLSNKEATPTCRFEPICMHYLPPRSPPYHRPSDKGVCKRLLLQVWISCEEGENQPVPQSRRRQWSYIKLHVTTNAWRNCTWPNAHLVRH